MESVRKPAVKGGRAIIWPLSFTPLTRLRTFKALLSLKSLSLGFLLRTLLET